MRAVVYRGPGEARLEEVPEPAVRDSEDVVVRVSRKVEVGEEEMLDRSEHLSELYELSFRQHPLPGRHQ